MAKTAGHGNPNWTKDETILALELYLECEGHVPSAGDPRVVGLSEALRGLPYHSGANKRESFRNPDGVAFKLQNLRQVATGKGLGNVSRTDRLVWEQFGSDPDRVRAAAKLIRQARDLEADAPADESDFEFAEGRIATRIHKQRERAKGLRAALIMVRRKAGHLSCDLCNRTEKGTVDGYGDALFEAHHIVPICESTGQKTRLKDLALLCACCHRMIHRAISIEGRWLSLDETRSLLFST